MQPLSGNQPPDIRTCQMKPSLVLRLPHAMYLRKSSSNVPCLPSFLKQRQNPHVLLIFEKVQNPLRLSHKMTVEPPTAVRTRTQCAYHFDFNICFAPQQRAILNISSDQIGSAPAALASLLFDPPELQIIGKSTVLRGFSTSWRTWIFLFLLFSSLIFINRKFDF